MAFRLTLFFVLIGTMLVVAILSYNAVEKSVRRPPQVAIATEQILVAGAVLHAGNLLQPGDLASSTIAVGSAPSGASLDTPENRSKLIGSMVRTVLSPGAPLLDKAIIRPGDHGFLAAVLAPGMRAVTVGVDAVSGAAGLIWPGDHVDVLLTQTLDDPSVPPGQRIAAELVLADVRVIATGQQLVQGNVSDPEKPQTPATTVTLEVTPEQAERCEVATHLGPLSLVVHSLKSSETAPSILPSPVWADQVSPALSNLHPGPGVISTVHVYNGAADGEDYKF